MKQIGSGRRPNRVPLLSAINRTHDWHRLTKHGHLKLRNKVACSEFGVIDMKACLTCIDGSGLWCGRYIMAHFGPT